MSLFHNHQINLAQNKVPRLSRSLLFNTQSRKKIGVFDIDFETTFRHS